MMLSVFLIAMPFLCLGLPIGDNADHQESPRQVYPQALYVLQEKQAEYNRKNNRYHNFALRESDNEEARSLDGFAPADDGFKRDLNDHQESPRQVYPQALYVLQEKQAEYNRKNRYNSFALRDSNTQEEEEMAARSLDENLKDGFKREAEDKKQQKEYKFRRYIYPASLNILKEESKYRNNKRDAELKERKVARRFDSGAIFIANPDRMYKLLDKDNKRES